MKKQAEYFRLYRFGDEKIGIPITRAEAERAIYAQATGRVFLSKEGSISGSSISAVLPDFNRALGYNEDYRLTGEDRQYIKRDAPEYIGSFEELNTRVKHLIDTKREHLIGILVSLPELERELPKELSAQSAEIAKKFDIK
jgi:hypothetical protein